MVEARTTQDEAIRDLLHRGRLAFPDFQVRRLARTRSTQDIVRAAARGGAAPGFVVLAEEQTAGRGRQGRRWYAQPGSCLLLSVLVRPRASLGLVPLASGLAVADALAERCGVVVGLRWPNDVLAPTGGKLAGILAEVEPRAPADPTSGPAVVVGIGLNLAVDEFPADVAGASLHTLVAPAAPPPAPTLAADILVALAKRLASLDDGGALALLSDWRRAAVGLGQPIRAVTPQGDIRGTAVDVDADGALVVEAVDGARHRLVAADVHIERSPTRGGIS